MAIITEGGGIPGAHEPPIPRTEELWGAFLDWILAEYGWVSWEYALVPKSSNLFNDEMWESWLKHDLFVKYQTAGYPGFEHPLAEQMIGYDEILADQSLSPQEKYDLIKELHPNRIMDWLNTEEGFAYLGNFADQDIKTGAYTLPDGTQVMLDPNTGRIIGITPEEELPALPAPGEGVYASDGTLFGIKLEDGTYIDKDGIPTTLEQIQGWRDNYEKNKTSPPMPDPTAYPTEPNTEGFEWFWDGDQWVETKIEPDITIPEGYTIDEETGFLRDAEGNLFFQDPDTGDLTLVTPGVGDVPPPFPTDPPPEGYAWQYDPNTNTYVPVYTGEEEPYEMPPYPTEPPPTGYIWDYNPNTGQWELTPGQLPGTLPEITPFQESQIELENRALELQQWGMQADQAWRQAQLEQQQRETEAQMLTQPASWLEYAALTGKQAAVQPWMPHLQLGDYPGMQTGAPLYGWGPEWEDYYGGQAGAQAPGGIPPTGGVGQPPIGGQPPTGGVGPQGLPAGEGWEPSPGGGMQQTGGQPYDREKSMMMGNKHQEIRQAILNHLGYGTPAWDEYINSFLDPNAIAYQDRFSQADYSLRNWVTAQAEQMARQWYAQTYGEEYPYYPGQRPETVNIPYGISPPPLPNLDELLAPTPPEPPPPTPPVGPSPSGFIPGQPAFPTAMQRGVVARQPAGAAAFRQPLTALSSQDRAGYIRPERGIPGPSGMPISELPQVHPEWQRPIAPPTQVTPPATGGFFPQPSTTLPPIPTYDMGGQIPGYYDPSKLPQLMTPSRQYEARMGPTALQQRYGYEQARTGALPEETKWRSWSGAPPSGRFPGVRHRR